MLDLESDSRGKCPGRALGSVLLFVSSFLLLLYFLSKLHSALDPVWLDSIGLYQKVLWAGLIFVICLVSSLVSRLVCPGLSAVRDLGLKEEFPGRLKARFLGFLLGAFFVTAIISQSPCRRLSVYRHGGSTANGALSLLYFISAVNEEMVFRGFLFQSLERGFGLK
ncbi:MAG: hypothetical protein R3D26_01475 [Cyanobacteriota/Melainabacteria group bacterium]